MSYNSSISLLIIISPRISAKDFKWQEAMTYKLVKPLIINILTDVKQAETAEEILDIKKELKEDIIREKLRTLDIVTLKHLENDSLKTWSWTQKQLEKLKDGKPKAVLQSKDLGYDEAYLNELADYAIGNHLLCLEIIEEKKEDIFGPKPKAAGSI